MRSFNVGGRAELQQLLADIHANGETLTLVDHEGGSVQLPEIARAPAASEQGRGTPDETRATGEAVGADLKAVGFDIDLAPVADVRPAGATDIGSRSFGSDVAVVSEHALAFAEGLRQAAIIPAFKHFPGYGRAQGDAHLELTSVDAPLEELRTVDVAPFERAVAAGMPLIMISHLHYSALDAEGVPGTISSSVIDGLLRQTLGFKGVVITDSLGMGAITLTVGSADGAVLALKAGADLLLLTHHVSELPAFVERMQRALDSGEVSRERVLEALGRVAALQRMAHGGEAACLTGG